ncbi:unnamed protein product [Debaryomyces fabryi]|nr:unnamed protein product [Debaryomyces fabryi]
MIIIYVGSKIYFKGPFLIPLIEIDLDNGLFLEDDIINAKNTIDKGVFRGFYDDVRTFIDDKTK